MNNKRTSLLLMVLAFLLLLLGDRGSVPPRQLTADHIRHFALVPLSAFFVALPGVPTRWFAYFSALAVAPLVGLFSCQIRETSFQLGYDQGMARVLLPILIVLAVVVLAILAARLRIAMQTRIQTRLRRENRHLNFL